MLYFMAYTYTYFRSHEYAGFQSVKFDMHEIDYGRIGDKTVQPKKPE